jgi:hypothetical protein
VSDDKPPQLLIFIQAIFSFSPAATSRELLWRRHEETVFLAQFLLERGSRNMRALAGLFGNNLGEELHILAGHETGN